LGWVCVVDGPVPVWLSAFVAAFGAEGLLVEPEVVAVKVEEDALMECQWVAAGYVVMK